MREIVMKWKIAIIIIGIVVLSGITIFLVYPRFMEKDFRSEIEIPLNEQFNLYDKENNDLYYSNFFDHIWIYAIYEFWRQFSNCFI